MTENIDEVRCWWVFETPGSVCAVPAASEVAARAVLIRHSHNVADVIRWPLVCTRVTSRRSLISQLLGKPYFAGPTVIEATL